jgi:hypothetical protein
VKLHHVGNLKLTNSTHKSYLGTVNRKRSIGFKLYFLGGRVLLSLTPDLGFVNINRNKKLSMAELTSAQSGVKLLNRR